MYGDVWRTVRCMDGDVWDVWRTVRCMDGECGTCEMYGRGRVEDGEMYGRRHVWRPHRCVDRDVEDVWTGTGDMYGGRVETCMEDA
jgi:hypothetical protein